MSTKNDDTTTTNHSNNLDLDPSTDLASAVVFDYLGMFPVFVGQATRDRSLMEAEMRLPIAARKEFVSACLKAVPREPTSGDCRRSWDGSGWRDLEQCAMSSEAFASLHTVVAGVTQREQIAAEKSERDRQDAHLLLLLGKYMPKVRTADDIHQAILDLERELILLAGEPVILWSGRDGGTTLNPTPATGASLTILWAINDQSSEWWYPNAEGARAALVTIVRQEDGELHEDGWGADLTKPGCNSSRAYITRLGI